MITVISDAKKVLVFKSAKQPPLRVFPGPNNIDVDAKKGLDDYFKGNRAAQGFFKDHCRIVEAGKFNNERAETSRLKNNELNKAWKLVKATKTQLKVKSDENADLLKQLAEMAERLKKLEAKE